MLRYKFELTPGNFVLTLWQQVFSIIYTRRRVGSRVGADLGGHGQVVAGKSCVSFSFLTTSA